VSNSEEESEIRFKLRAEDWAAHRFLGNTNTLFLYIEKFLRWRDNAQSQCHPLHSEQSLSYQSFG
jgi:hypothetical protein